MKCINRLLNLLKIKCKKNSSNFSETEYTENGIDGRENILKIFK